MAKMETSGIDAFVHDLEKLSNDVDAIKDEMLSEGGNVAVQAWRKGITDNDYIDTGAMLNSVGMTKKADKSSVEIYPKGKDAKGVRNAEKAFILNYGTSRKQGSRFVEKLEADAETDIFTAMEKVKDDYLSKHKI